MARIQPPGRQLRAFRHWSSVCGHLPIAHSDAPVVEAATALPERSAKVAGPTVDASALPEQLREQFHRNLRAVEQVRACASQTRVAAESGISRSTLSRLVQRTRKIGQIGCRPHGSYRRSTTMHPAFQECIRRLYLFPMIWLNAVLMRCARRNSVSRSPRLLPSRGSWMLKGMGRGFLRVPSSTTRRPGRTTSGRNLHNPAGHCKLRSLSLGQLLAQDSCADSSR